MVEVTKKSTIGEILAQDIGTAKYFLDMGMHCLGCPSSQGESIEDACAVHGTSVEELVANLNAYFAQSN